MLPFEDTEAQLAYEVFDYAFGDDQFCAEVVQLKRRKLFLAQIGPMASCVERAARDDTQNGVLSDRQIAAMRNLTAVLGGPRRGHALDAAVLRPLREELIDAMIYNVWEAKKYPVAIVGNPLSMTNRNSNIIADMPYYYPPDPRKKKAKSSWKVANEAKTFSPAFSLHNSFLIIKRYDRDNFQSLNIRANNQASRKPPSTIKRYEIADLETREDYFVVDAARHFFVHAVRRKEALLKGIAKVAEMRGRPISDVGQEWFIDRYGDFIKGADALTGSYRAIREEYEATVKSLSAHQARASQRLALRGRG